MGPGLLLAFWKQLAPGGAGHSIGKRQKTCRLGTQEGEVGVCPVGHATIHSLWGLSLLFFAGAYTDQQALHSDLALAGSSNCVGS